MLQVVQPEPNMQCFSWLPLYISMLAQFGLLRFQYLAYNINSHRLILPIRWDPGVGGNQFCQFCQLCQFSSISQENSLIITNQFLVHVCLLTSSATSTCCLTLIIPGYKQMLQETQDSCQEKKNWQFTSFQVCPQ